MIGTITNSSAILAGCVIGSILKKGIAIAAAVLFCCLSSECNCFTTGYGGFPHSRQYSMLYYFKQKMNFSVGFN